MAVSNFGSKGLTTCSKQFLRNLNIFSNKDSCIFQRRSVSYNLFDIKYKTAEVCKVRSTIQNFCTGKAITRNVEVNNSGYCSTSTFQQHMHFRKKQAERSVIVELINKLYIPHATSACQQFGVIKNLYSYSGESENVFLLLEFDHEDSVKKFLSHCQYENISDSFTAFSRIVRFENKFFHDSAPEMTVNVKEDDTDRVRLKVNTVSELIEDIYRTEKISELSTRLRFFFCVLVKDCLSGIFPYCEVLPFGSSVNGVGRHNCDLDIMLRLYPLPTYQTCEFSFLNKTCVGNVQELQKKSVNVLTEIFRTFLPGFSSLKKILHARVPILKFTHKILGMECDLSVNNMSAILMSEMLYFCGEIDPRVRPLLYAVKKWAKEANVTYEAPGSWITNFGLSLLVIFFLQNRPIPVLPCLNDVVEIIGAECTTNFKLEYLSPLPELQATASSNTESLAELLKEFLTFLGSHPFKDKHISILSGKATQKQSGSCIWVQYPLEEEKNVTKNISARELFDMCEKARISSRTLANNMQLKRNSSMDLSLILGIPNVMKLFAPKKNDVNSLFKITRKAF